MSRLKSLKPSFEFHDFGARGTSTPERADSFIKAVLIPMTEHRPITPSNQKPAKR